MSQGNRVRRVEEAVHRVVGEKIITEVELPLIERITVTGVKMSSDLKYAEILFSIIATNEEEKQTIFNSILRKKKEIRFIIGRELNLRYVPELTFTLDETAEKAARIQRILNQIQEERNESDG